MRKLLPFLILLFALLIGAALWLVMGGPGAPDPVDTGRGGEDVVAPEDDPETTRKKTATVSNRWVPKGPGSVRGVVLEYGTDRALAGVEVSLEAGLPGPNEIIKAKTGADGSFVIDSAVNFDAWTLHVAEQPPLVPLQLAGVEVVEGQETDVGVLYLTPGFSIPGEVVDERGDPVAGAVVRALRLRPEGSRMDFTRLIREMGQVRPSVDTATTDAAGQFALTSVPPGRYDFEITAKGFSNRLERGVIVTPESSERRLRFMIVRGYTIDGRVIRTNGGPVGGLKVIAFEEPRGMDGLFDLDKRFAITNDEGEFQIEGLGAGEFIVLVAPEGEPFAIKDDVAIPGTDYVELVIEGDAWLEGTVTNAEDEPVAEAEVFVVSVDRDNPVVGNGVTAGNGYYRLDGLRSGPVQIFLVQADGYGTYPEDLMSALTGRGAGMTLQAGRNERDVQLDKGAVVRGVVLSQDDDTPIGGVRVTLASPLAFFGGTRAATTDEEGKFEIRSVPKGPGMLMASKDGWYQPGVTPQSMGMVLGAAMRGGGAQSDPGKGASVFVSDPGQVVERELKLATGSTLRGQVLSPAGEPVAGAQVQVTMGQSGGMMGQLTALFPLAEPRLTDVDGNFELPGPPPAQQAHVVARSQGFLDGKSDSFKVGPGEVKADLVVKLREGSTLEGVVKGPDGKPLEGALVRWITKDEDTNEWQIGWQLRRADPVSTDAEGHFSAPHIEPGELIVQAKHPEFLSASTSGVQAADGKSAKVNFDLRTGGRLHGVVLGPDGKPYSGATVDLNRQGNDSVEGDAHYRNPNDPSTDAEGAWSVAGLAPGKYRVRAEAEGLAPSPQLDVEAGGPAITLQLSPAFEISGMVRLEDGSPVAGANVEAHLVGDDGKKSEKGDDRTTDKGEFTIRDIPGGTYELRVNSSGWWPQGRANILPATVEDVQAGQGGVVITVAAGLRIKGKVVLRDPEAPRSGWANASRIPDKDEPKGTPQSNSSGGIVDGEFELTGLTPGRYRVQVNVENQSARILEIEAGNEDVVVEIGVGATVTGRVTAADGSPAGGVNVWASGPSGQGNDQTEPDGTFEIQGLAAGEYTVNAWQQKDNKTYTGQSESVSVTEGDSRGNVEIVLAEQQPPPPK